MHVLVVCLAMVLLASPAKAVKPDEVLADPALEARARSLSLELRCLVCQNQSIDDSDAPLARDLRLLVRERLKAGDSDAAIRSFLVQRYGEFVLLKPPFKLETLLLWISPFAILATASLGVLAARRRRRGDGLAMEAPLSEAERAELTRLTKRDPS
jgi:cytochrome c-type biogenesis protein CcmH